MCANPPSLVHPFSRRLLATREDRVSALQLRHRSFSCCSSRASFHLRGPVSSPWCYPETPKVLVSTCRCAVARDTLRSRQRGRAKCGRSGDLVLLSCSDCEYFLHRLVPVVC